MSAVWQRELQPEPALDVRYVSGAPEALLADEHVLALISFGADPEERSKDPRHLPLSLRPLPGVAETQQHEMWLSPRRVTRGEAGELRWASDGVLQFGTLELVESDCGGPAATAVALYTRLLDFVASSGFPHLLRIWNYLDAITEGEGDGERYRQFNVGRARAMEGRLREYPAATAIGRFDGRRSLQVYWLAAASPGVHLENPRQVSAFHYPCSYGPRPPKFARATLLSSAAMPLLLSGTASVVGHRSTHPGDLGGQLDETFQNFASLLREAGFRRTDLQASFSPHSLLKVYLRRPELAATLRAALSERLPTACAYLLLHGEICRRELLLEIDGWHR